MRASAARRRSPWRLRSVVVGGIVLLAAGIAGRAAPVRQKASSDGHREREKAARVLTPAARAAFIRRAQIRMPTDIPAMDLSTGPAEPGAFAPNQVVTCDFVNQKLPGTSNKFACAITPDDVVKVRYGPDNGKVEGEVLGSRLLWALGFGADRVYPVRITCRGCPADPWTEHHRVPRSVAYFDPAAIERKPAGHEMTYEGDTAGWFWPELDRIDDSQGGASRAQRDGLKLLAVLMQHTDSKPVQQRLLCLPGGLTDDGCEKPFMMIHDVGLTFGHGNFFNRTVTGSVNFDQWVQTPIWRDAGRCVGHLSESITGTLGDPVISEAGRQFLAGLLVQLSDRQLHDLFTVARVDKRSRKPNSAEPPASADEWVAVFKQKRDEIVNHRCR